MASVSLRKVARQPLKTPAHCHWAVRWLVAELNVQKMASQYMCTKAGIHINTVTEWANHRIPRIDNIEACINVLGYKLMIVPIEDDSMNDKAARMYLLEKRINALMEAQSKQAEQIAQCQSHHQRVMGRLYVLYKKLGLQWLLNPRTKKKETADASAE